MPYLKELPMRTRSSLGLLIAASLAIFSTAECNHHNQAEQIAQAATGSDARGTLP